MAVPRTQQASQRSTLVTVLAWITMACSGLLLPISFISLLMLLAGSDGSSNATFGGVFTVVLLPPFAFVAGIGLLLRQRWAWLFLLALLAALLAVQVVELATPPGPPVTTVAPDGLRTTTFSSGDPLVLPLAIACALGLLALLSPGVRRDCRARLGSARDGLGDAFRSAARGRNTAEPERPGIRSGRSAGQDGWRVSHQGRDAMVYEERHGLSWRRIDIDGEMLLGRPHHVIYFASPSRWREYPDWARDRRDEIIGRITSVFRAPDYAYRGLGPDEHATASEQAGERTRAPAAGTRTHRIATTREGMGALAFVLVLLLVLTGVTTWLVLHGIQTGATWQPGARASHWHAVARADAPLSFWASLAIYAVVGIASLVFALLGVRAMFAGRRQR